MATRGVVRGHVGERQKAGHVADGEDAPRARAQAVVDHDGASLIGAYAGGVDADPGSPRPSPGHDQQLVELDGVGSVGRLDHEPRRLPRAAMHLQGARRDAYIDPLGGQPFLDERTRAGLLLEQEAVGQLHDRDVGTESGKRLPQLAADGPSTEDDQPPR